MNWRDVLQDYADRAGLTAIWAIDTEYQTADLRGNRIKHVWCVCGVELLSGKEIRMWTGEGQTECPFPVTAEDVAFAAHNAAAEGQAFKVLGWDDAAFVIDTMMEQRRATNLDDGISAKERFGSLSPTLSLARGWGLVASLKSYGLEDHIPEDKEDMRNLAIFGGPWNDKKRADLMDYCLDDCRALGPLLAALLPSIEAWGDVAENRAQVRARGCSSWAMGGADLVGIPVDVDACKVLQEEALQIAAEWIDEDAPGAQIYERGDDGSYHLRMDRVNALIETQYDPNEWPRTESGAYTFDSDTLRDLSEVWPSLLPYRNAEALRALLKSVKFKVETDGRLHPTWHLATQKTQRTSVTGSPFAMTKGLRPLLKPGPDEVFVVLDWISQEFGIAAALSRDPQMLAAYRDPADVYLAFARQAGMIRDADWLQATAAGEDLSKTFAEQRKPSKIIILGTQFGMTAHGMARGLKSDVAKATRLLRKHQRVYSQFHDWSRTVVDEARQKGYAFTAFGWVLRATSNARERTLKNLPIQGTGADIMRVALILAQNEGLKVCATVHDALAFSMPVDQWQEQTQLAASLMSQAGEIVIGEPLGVDGQAVMPGERFGVKDDPLKFWNRLAPRIGAECLGEGLGTTQKNRVLGALSGP